MKKEELSEKGQQCHCDCCHDHHDHHEHSHDECACGCGHNHEEERDKKREFVRYALGAIPIIIGFLSFIPFHIPLIASIVGYLIFGIEVFHGMILGLKKRKFFTEFTLMTVATLGAFAIGEFADAAALMYLYSLGETLSSGAYARSKKSISELFEISAEQATVIRNGEAHSVSPESVLVGETVLVREGERVPLDGIVTGGGAFADTSSVTGEARPLELYDGIACPSGTVLSGGSVYIKVSMPYEDSVVYKMQRAVEQANERRSSAEKKITKFASIFTPIAFGAAALIFIVGSILTGDAVRWLRAAITTLVVSCPCSLVLSVPLAYFAGLGNAARNGIVFRGGEVMDVCARLRAVAFDKTGTLTEANMTYVGARTFTDMTERDFLDLAYSVLIHSPHVVALSFCEAEKNSVTQKAEIENTHILGGRGIVCDVGGKRVLFGNGRLMRENGIDAVDTQATCIYGACDGVLLGRLDFSSRVKQGVKQAVSEMRRMGVRAIAVISGDAPEAVSSACIEIGVNEYYSSCVPDEKLEIFEKISEREKADNKGGAVAYCGDGLNDSAVIARADVGIAMGKSGAALTVESADIVLMDDDLQKIPTAMRIAKRTSAIATSNIALSLGIKLAVLAAGVLLAYFNVTVPIELAVVADVGAAIIAVLNSLRALK